MIDSFVVTVKLKILPTFNAYWHYGLRGMLQVVSEQELKHLGLLGSKRSYIFHFEINDFVLFCDNRDQQVHSVRQSRSVFHFFRCSLVGVAKSIQLTFGWVSIQQYLGYISGHPISLMQSTPQLLVMHWNTNL